MATRSGRPRGTCKLQAQRPAGRRGHRLDTRRSAARRLRGTEPRSPRPRGGSTWARPHAETIFQALGPLAVLPAGTGTATRGWRSRWCVLLGHLAIVARVAALRSFATSGCPLRHGNAPPLTRARLDAVGPPIGMAMSTNPRAPLPTRSARCARQGPCGLAAGRAGEASAEPCLVPTSASATSLRTPSIRHRRLTQPTGHLPQVSSMLR